MLRLASVVIVLLAVSPGCHQAVTGEGETGECMALLRGPQAMSQELASGVPLFVSLRRDYTQHDAISLDFAVQNWTDRLISLEMIDTNVGPEITLIDSTGRKRVRQFPLARAQEFRFQEAARRLETALSFRVDLRAEFGVMTPGDYQLECRWPAEFVRVRTEGGAPTSDALNVGALPFSIHQLELAEIRRRLFKDKRARTIPRSSRVVGPHLRATTADLTNKTSNPIFIYLDRDSSMVPAQSPREIECRRWTPNGGLYQGKFLDLAGVARGEPDKLDPGEKISIVLPDWGCREDGVYYYVIPYYIPFVDAEGKSRIAGGGYFLTEPFVVEQVTSSRKKS